MRDDSDDHLKKDIDTRGSSSYKNSGICSFDVSKNICQVLCHRTQGGSGIEKKRPGVDFFAKDNSVGLTNLPNQARFYIW